MKIQPTSISMEWEPGQADGHCWCHINPKCLMEIKFREIYLFWRDCFTKKRCDSLPKLLPSARWMVEGGSYSVPCTGQPSLLQCACACQCTGQPSLLHISDRDQRWTDQWAGGCRGQQTLQYLIGERFSKFETFFRCWSTNLYLSTTNEKLRFIDGWGLCRTK